MYHKSPFKVCISKSVLKDKNPLNVTLVVYLYLYTVTVKNRPIPLDQPIYSFSKLLSINNKKNYP